MGIRISKCMGFFLPLEDISKVFDKEKLSQVLEDEPTFSFNEFEKCMLSYNHHGGSKVSLHTYNNNDIDIVNHIVKIYQYDDLEGLLFQSIEAREHNRYNNLIDYHEHLERYGEHKFVIQQIYENPNIFSQSYIYKGPSINKLTHNQIIYNLNELYLEYGQHFKATFPTKSLIEAKVIELDVDTESWAFAQLTNCLQPNISPLEFNSFVKPVIITNWA